MSAEKPICVSNRCYTFTPKSTGPAATAPPGTTRPSRTFRNGHIQLTTLVLPLFLAISVGKVVMSLQHQHVPLLAVARRRFSFEST
ncbi:hypothetical protein L596_002075 [Steinernema carpocapsae]|uniref:Uncharacterized protein n=1 Tax=Steinernema carpocapsae TaxID=34508 RepID=A0A4V6I7K5_STECR|nr:hypothetical protein L596_002075 [Steinernema carpocapsae]